MSWFEEQIAYRELRDEEILSDAYMKMAGAIVGRRLQQAWQDGSYAAETALQEIFRYFHLKPMEIPDQIKDLNGQLDYVLQPLGITRREIRLTPGWQKDAVSPMLATRKSDGRVVALIPGKTGGYTFTDLETGKKTRVNSQNADQLDEEALVFYQPFPLRKITIRDLIRYMSNCLDFFDLFSFIISVLMVTLMGMIMPRLNQMLFSDIVEYGSIQLLLAVMSFMISVTVSRLMMNTIRTILLTRINTKLNLSVQAAGMMRVLSMPPDFFKKYTSGELNEIVQYMNSLCNTLVNTVFSTGFTGLFSLVYVGQISAYAASLTVPAMLVTIVTLLFSVLTVFIQMKYSKESMELSAKEKGMVYSVITGVQKIRLAGAEKRVFARWGKLYAREAELAYNPPTFLKMNSVISTAISLAGMILMYFVAVQSRVSVADYYAFNSAYGYVTAAFTGLASIAGTFATIRPVLEIVKPLMETEPEVAEGKEVVTRVTGRIELNHVSFRYDEDQPWILDDISLRIKPGQYIAVVGKTGCGKSTLMRLLLGFEKPQKGSIFYDSVDMEKIDKKSLRRKIGVVIQNSKLVWGDIYSNITIAAPWLDLNAAWEAAEIADIADDIRAMPMGMQTIIQEGSGGISGGQKQRIMIARAVAAKPKILFLDEATSALDNLTQKKVSEALDKMKCTRIVIAHRLSTIRQCDRILVLDQGRIIEDGTYDELIAKNGFFAELVSRQRVNAGEGVAT